MSASAYYTDGRTLFELVEERKVQTKAASTMRPAEFDCTYVVRNCKTEYLTELDAVLFNTLKPVSPLIDVDGEVAAFNRAVEAYGG